MKRLLIFAVLVAFSGSVFAGAVMPTSSRYTSGVLNSTPALNESNVYTFPTPAAGGIPINITANNVYPIGGDPSYVSRVGTAALGVGLVAAGLFSAPAVVVTLNVLAAGSAGYMLWQALKSNGVSVDSSGVPQAAGVFIPAHYSSYSGQGFTGSMEQICAYIAARYTPPYNSVPVFYTCDSSAVNCSIYRQGQDCGGACWMASSASGSTLIPNGNGPSTPATNSQISDAVAAAIASPSVADDTLNFAIAHGLDVKSMLPPATANTAPAPAPYIGPEYTTGTQTDASGNTVRTTEQVTTMLVPGATAADRATATQTKTVRNYLNDAVSPSTSSTAVSTPSVLSPALAGVPAGSSPVTVLNPAASVAPAAPMPTDYNREVTQTSVLTALTVAPGATIPDSETSDITALTGDSGSLPVMNRSALAGTVTLPSSSSCIPLELSLSGHSFTADPCPMILYLHPLVNYLFTFLFGILILRTALKNDELAGG